jgi:methyl-accepting chemotaxis protein
VAAIKTIGGTIAEVSEVSTAIAQAIEQQGAAVREISRSTNEAATSAAAVATNIAGVSGAADNTRKTAAQELAAADTLAAQANALRGEVDTFLVGIRAA